MKTFLGLVAVAMLMLGIVADADARCRRGVRARHRSACSAGTASVGCAQCNR
jgi:hypothetical protein